MPRSWLEEPPRRTSCLWKSVHTKLWWLSRPFSHPMLQVPTQPFWSMNTNNSPKNTKMLPLTSSVVPSCCKIGLTSCNMGKLSQERVTYQQSFIMDYFRKAYYTLKVEFSSFDHLNRPSHSVLERVKHVKMLISYMLVGGKGNTEENKSSPLEMHHSCNNSRMCI